MTFEEIDHVRRSNGRTISELCRAAGISRSTYKFLRAGKFQISRRTQQRLQAALKRSKEPIPRSRAEADRIIGDLYRAYVVILAKELGQRPERALAADPQARANGSKAWRDAAYVRALAIYCVTVELGVTAARVGRIVGLTRAGVSRINRRVEDFRDDPSVDALLERVASLVSNRNPLT